jgi:hypothetical protein
MNPLRTGAREHMNPLFGIYVVKTHLKYLPLPHMQPEQLLSLSLSV